MYKGGHYLRKYGKTLTRHNLVGDNFEKISMKGRKVQDFNYCGVWGQTSSSAIKKIPKIIVTNSKTRVIQLITTLSKMFSKNHILCRSWKTKQLWQQVEFRVVDKDDRNRGEKLKIYRHLLEKTNNQCQKQHPQYPRKYKET